MKIYTAEKDYLKDIPLHVDVACIDCGKIHALSNCAYNQHCIQCGGHCK